MEYENFGSHLKVSITESFHSEVRQQTKVLSVNGLLICSQISKLHMQLESWKCDEELITAKRNEENWDCNVCYTYVSTLHVMSGLLIKLCPSHYYGLLCHGECYIAVLCTVYCAVYCAVYCDVYCAMYCTQARAATPASSTSTLSIRAQMEETSHSVITLQI